MSRRSYAHYCAVSRALDLVGDRWSLLVVRELCSGPRRYSDLFADLPGISTDMLAVRLKELERDGILTRTKAGPRATTALYELTDVGHSLRPVLEALSAFGIEHLGDRRPTDAVRAHWFALPLGKIIAEHHGTGTVNVRVGDTAFHYVIDESGISHHDGEATAAQTISLDLADVADIVAGRRTLSASR